MHQNASAVRAPPNIHPPPRGELTTLPDILVGFRQGGKENKGNGGQGRKDGWKRREKKGEKKKGRKSEGNRKSIRRALPRFLFYNLTTGVNVNYSVITEELL